MPIIEELRSGVDWLSLTLGTEDPYNAEWRLKFTRYLESLTNAGYRLIPRAMLGYSGISAGNCFVGAREDGYLMQATGYHAEAAFNDMFHPNASVPRLDLQVTVKFDEMPTNIVDDGYEQSASANRELPLSRQRKIWKIVGSSGGETLYIGSWHSSQYGYIYNKEVQSEDPAYTRCWRYEVRLKHEYAHTIYRTIERWGSSRQIFIAAFVSEWFGNRGLVVPWTSDDIGDILPIVKTRPSDVERSLEWLERQVKPTIQRLVDLGLMDEVAKALGILL
jgi:hypothetical protein